MKNDMIDGYIMMTLYK